MMCRRWPVLPNYARVTVGGAADMQSFQTAFLEVQQMSTDKVNAMVHPYPHLLYARVC
jgi:hypothetical protein